MSYEGSSFVFDERRKELRGSKTWLMKGEEEIKKTLTDLENQKKGYESSIEKKKEILEVPELTPEQEKLQKDLEALQKHQLKNDKQKEIEENLKVDQDDLDAVNADIRKIKEAIGSRLNL